MSPRIGEIIGRGDLIGHSDILEKATRLFGPDIIARLKKAIDPAVWPAKLQQIIAEHEAKRVERQREPKRATWNDTVNAPSGRPRQKPGPVTPKLEGRYLPTGGFYRMPNAFVDELLTVMPTPVLRGYVLCHRLADLYGVFWCSGETMATKIGSNDPRLGRRVITRLRDAGMLLLHTRGSKATGFANVYQLVPLELLDLDRVKAVLQRPLNGKSRVSGAA